MAEDLAEGAPDPPGILDLIEATLTDTGIGPGLTGAYFASPARQIAMRVDAIEGLTGVEFDTDEVMGLVEHWATSEEGSKALWTLLIFRAGRGVVVGGSATEGSYNNKPYALLNHSLNFSDYLDIAENLANGIDTLPTSGDLERYLETLTEEERDAMMKPPPINGLGHYFERRKRHGISSGPDAEPRNAEEAG